MRSLSVLIFCCVCCVMDTSAVTWSYLTNGTVQIGVDKDRGACIGYFSLSSGANLLNNYDNGRFIQQSYYGDSDGSSWAGQDWAYNPVQGGGYLNQWPATLLAFTNSGGRIYAKIRPCHWATGASLPEVEMEEWITLKGNMAHIHNRMKYSGSSQVTFKSQEMPAVFVDYALADLVFYEGAHPWENEALTSVTVAPANPPALEYHDRTEHWAAYVNTASRSGIGIYTPDSWKMVAYRYNAGSATGPSAPSCSYFAPTRQFTLTAGCSVEYDTFLAIGTDVAIRQAFYDIHANGYDSDNDGMEDSWEYEQFSSLDTASNTSDYDSDGLTDYNEFVAGTDPKDVLEGLYLSDLPDRSLFWSGDWGRRYRVQWTSNLLANSWADIYTNQTGNPSYNTFIPTGVSQADFYRVSARVDNAARTYGWNFNNFSPGIAWRPGGNVTSLEITNGVLRSTFTNWPNYIITSSWTPMFMEASNYPCLSVRMKNQSDTKYLTVRFYTDSVTNSKSFAISSNDTAFQTYEINMATSFTNWSGVVRQLQLSLLNSTNGAFELDHVMFYNQSDSTSQTSVVTDSFTGANQGTWATNDVQIAAQIGTNWKRGNSADEATQYRIYNNQVDIGIVSPALITKAMLINTATGTLNAGAGTNFTLSATLQQDSSLSTAFMGLVFNYQDAGNYYLFRAAGNGTVQMLCYSNGVQQASPINTVGAFTAVQNRPYTITVASADPYTFDINIFDTVSSTTVYSKNITLAANVVKHQDGLGGMYATSGLASFDNFVLDAEPGL
ncbi:MAG: hypothetical protein HOO88_06085 [Kiritimatiellaceae bacterium]|nr:hypothetical protein [Kiritimatiellaceae bacterium]